jgi:hypothetical protein
MNIYISNDLRSFVQYILSYFLDFEFYEHLYFKFRRKHAIVSKELLYKGP